MSYCRFENTYKALAECSDHIRNREEVSNDREIRYAHKLYELCREFLSDCDEYGMYDGDGDFVEFNNDPLDDCDE